MLVGEQLLGSVLSGAMKTLTGEVAMTSLLSRTGALPETRAGGGDDGALDTGYAAASRGSGEGQSVGTAGEGRPGECVGLSPGVKSRVRTAPSWLRE